MPGPVEFLSGFVFLVMQLFKADYLQQWLTTFLPLLFCLLFRRRLEVILGHGVHRSLTRGKCCTISRFVISIVRAQRVMTLPFSL